MTALRKRENDVELPLPHRVFKRESGQSLRLLYTYRTGEESLDFKGADTSERLGVARLRKVQQKIYRFFSNEKDRMKMAASGAALSTEM